MHRAEELEGLKAKNMSISIRYVQDKYCKLGGEREEGKKEKEHMGNVGGKLQNNGDQGMCQCESSC